MLRCFSTLGCPDLSLEATLALARRHGIGAVELRALNGALDLPGYFSEKFGEPAALAAAVRPGGVQVVALDASLRLAGAKPADRGQLLAFGPWAEALGLKWLRVFDGVGADGPARAAAVEAWQWWRTERAARGWKVDLMVETHDALFTAGAIERFLAAVPGAAILWDAHHTWKRGGEDPVVTWRAVRTSVVHVHVKDSVPVPGPKHPFTYVLPGEGGFPMAPLRAALQADGFAGPVSLEWEKFWHPELAPLDTALAAAARGWW